MYGYSYAYKLRIGSLLNQINISLSVVSNSSIKIDWNGNDLKTYSIYRSIDGINYSLIDTTSGSTYTDSGLTEGTLYYYRIKLGNVYSNVDISIPYPVYNLVQDFDTLSELTLNAGFAVGEVDTSIKFDGDGSFHALGGGSTYSTVDFDLPNIQFTNGVLGLFRFFLPSDSNFLSASLYLSTTPTLIAGTWASGAMDRYGNNKATGFNGWNNKIFKRSDFSGGTPALLDNPSNVFVRARLRIEINKGAVYYDSIRFGGLQKPIICVMFDDQHETIMEVNDSVFGVGKSAFDYMNDNGIKGTIYVISSLVGNSGYLTISQLNDAYNAGWDLCNHTSSHPDITTLTESQIISELNTCNSFLVSNGWTRAAKHFAYPGGAFDTDVHPSLIQSLGYKTARTIETTLLNTQINPTNLFELWAKGVGSTVSVADMTGRVDQAISYGRMFATYIHAIRTPEDSYSWDPAKFKDFIDYLVTKKASGYVEIMTISEWYNLVI